MPLKKKEKPTTCNVGTNPMPLTQYDPLNLDDRRLIIRNKEIWRLMCFSCECPSRRMKNVMLIVFFYNCQISKNVGYIGQCFLHVYMLKAERSGSGWISFFTEYINLLVMYVLDVSYVLNFLYIWKENCWCRSCCCPLRDWENQVVAENHGSGWPPSKIDFIYRQRRAESAPRNAPTLSPNFKL